MRLCSNARNMYATLHHSYSCWLKYIFVCFVPSLIRVPVIVYARKSGRMFFRMGMYPVVEVVGVASTRKPEMVSVLERQVRVMEESFTSEIRTRRGGLMS